MPDLHTTPTLHITNGDSVRDTLRTVVADKIAITADPLHVGPAPAGVEGEDWCALRARFLAAAAPGSYEDVFRGLSAWDADIREAPNYEEVVLWFEHDLFDQLLLIRTLDMLAQSEAGSARRPRIFLICIDRFPGVDRFVGLGQLTADQLTSLVEQRRRLTDEMYRIAHEAWTAFRAPDPTALVELTVRLTSEAADAALPFLGEALKRFLAEYPSTRNGLSRTADSALQALRPGPLTGHRLFSDVQAAEAHPFMGDTTFFDIVERLLNARTALVNVETRWSPAGAGGVNIADARIRLTAAGQDVAAGRLDAVTLNGIDEWRGGVHLTSRSRSSWRWDPTSERLVS